MKKGIKYLFAKIKKKIEEKQRDKFCTKIKVKRGMSLEIVPGIHFIPTNGLNFTYSEYFWY